MSGSFLWDAAIPAVLTAIVVLFNIVAYFIRILFHSGKAQINPKSLVVVITGCDSGFGELSAVRLSQLGFNVVAGCLTKDGASRMEGSVARAVVCDITKEADVMSLVQETEQLVSSLNGHLWAVVNNAGIAASGPLDWVTLDSYRRIMEVNFFGHVCVTKAMLPLLKQCGESRIVNLSSVAGLTAGGNLSAYSASKHAMEGFLKSIVGELRPWHIYVCNINPAFMKTPMVMNNSIEKGMKTFADAPVNVQSQYNDPRPQLSEGERLVQSSSEDPLLVVDDIVNAITDARPQMWYYPGNAAKIFKTFCVASSDNLSYFLSKITEGTVHTPTSEILNRRKPVK